MDSNSSYFSVATSPCSTADLFVTLNRGPPTFDDYDYASTTPHPTGALPWR